MTQQQFEIYILEHPTTKQVKYVGLSKDARKRFKEHLRKCNPWIQELQSQGLQPVLRIIEQATSDLKTAQGREKYWIHYYEGQGYPLENITHNEWAIRAREEEEETYQRIYNTYARHLTPEKAQLLIKLFLIGHKDSGVCCFEGTYETVVRTINLLAKEPGFGLTLDEIDATRLTFKQLGIKWINESEVDR